MQSEAKIVVDKLGLTINGPIVSPNEGRIAKNFIVPTQEAGSVLVRVRSLTSERKDALLEYGPDRFEFEARVIEFLEKQGLAVPHLLSFASSGSTLLKLKDFYAFCYPLLQGHPISIDEIDNKIAADAGQLMYELVTIGTTYTPRGDEPDGDIDYIVRILRRALETPATNQRHPELDLMLGYLDKLVERRSLELSPRGIVHGDFFFENLIYDGKRIVGLIDFGDAYYGNVLMDVTTASMEFSIDSGSKWSRDRFVAFLMPLADWLTNKKISFDTFHYSLLANCIRFIAHTHSLSLASGENPRISDNPYAKRFFAFGGEMKSAFRSAYEQAIGISSRP